MTRMWQRPLRIHFSRISIEGLLQASLDLVISPMGDVITKKCQDVLGKFAEIAGNIDDDKRFHE